MNTANNKKRELSAEEEENPNKMIEDIERQTEIATDEMAESLADDCAEDKAYIEEPELEPGQYDDDSNDPEVLEDKALGGDDSHNYGKEYEE